MQFNFLIDEVYLISLFVDQDANSQEIKWFSEIKSNLPSKNVTVLLTKNLLSKSYNGVESVDVFYPKIKKQRDVALKFILYQEKNFKKYDASLITSVTEENTESEDFQKYLLSNNNIALVTKNDYSNEWWWPGNITSIFNDRIRGLDCVREMFIKHSDCDDDKFQVIAPILFPKTYFHWSNKLKLNNFGFEPIPLDWLIKSLSYLNDKAVDDYREDPGTFMSKAYNLGLVISPESTKTRKATRMMKERDIKISQSSICCEWHFKYSKTEGGRIHINFGYDVDYDTKKVTQGWPIVGIFANHLTIK